MSEMPDSNPVDDGPIGHSATMPNPTHRAMMAVDIASFSQPSQTDSIRHHLRNALYEILRDAFDASGVPWDSCNYEDRGDGVLIITPPDVAARLMDPLLLQLTAKVRRHNKVSSRPAQLRLRIAVHAGDVRFDEFGVVGSAVIRTARLLDSSVFKAALASSEFDIGLIVSDSFYDNVVRPGLGMLDPDGFQPIRVQVKETDTRGWVHIPGLSLYARDVGEGTPLVFLHAYPLSSAMWLAQREDLAKRFRVVTPDLRGFGGSTLGDAEPSIDIMADDVAATMRSKGIGKAVIVGLGMGGNVAMAFGRRHPDHLLGLVLANTTADSDSPHERQRQLDVASRIEAEESVDILVDELLPRLIGPTTLRQRALVYGRVRGLVQSTPFRAAAWAQRAIATRPDSFETLRRIRVPSLVIAGSEDYLTTVGDARAITEALPSSDLTVLQRCGHLTALESPELFNQAVTEFASSLTRIPGRPSGHRGRSHH